LRLAWHRPTGRWRVDETYIKVRGRWVYLYRVMDGQGQTIDFYLSQTPNTKAAGRFLSKALNGFQNMRETFCDPHRQSSHLRKSHRFPQTHARIKSMKTAYATIKGFERMHALRKGQVKLWMTSCPMSAAITSGSRVP